MNARRILIAVLVLAGAGLAFHQWRLQHAINQMSAHATGGFPADGQDEQNAAAKLRQAEASLNDVKAQLELAEHRLSTAQAQIAQLDQRLRQFEGGGRRRPGITTGFIPTDAPSLEEPTALTDTVKRSWGPEQAAGEPDTLQAGDIPTAWASLEQDGGEEWLKLDYETPVDIAEVRVRETHNPGAISKVTALLANGTEATLWEGTEPAATAPVEMSFQIPSGVNAKSVKVYLDTRRVPGWNEIDAVELIGRDGSHQWARQASASSTFAEPCMANRIRELERF